MPPPASQSAAQQESARTLFERTFHGLDLRDGPTAVPQGAFLELENLMPYGNGHIAVTPAPLAVASGPSGQTIAQIWAFDAFGIFVMVVQTSLGAIYAAQAGVWTWNNIVANGGTTVGGLHFVHWKAADAAGNPEALLWCDTAKGYGAMTGIASSANWVVESATLTGQAITIYAGRVWVAHGTQINFSGPDLYNDFTVADGGGAFMVTDPTLTGTIRGLYATQNWLYIVGGGMMALNNVQLTVVTAGTEAITTYFLTPVSASTAIANSRAALVWENNLFVVTNTGLWAYSQLNGMPLSANMGDNFAPDQTLWMAVVFGRPCICTSAGYVLMLDSREWFTAQADAQLFVSASWMTPSGTISYGASANTIYEIASDFISTRTCAWTTGLYDMGNASINKRAVRCAVEMFRNELVASPVQGTGAVATQLQGYASQSAPMLDTGWNIAVDQWFPHTTNLQDRYFAHHGDLFAPPGTAIGTFYIQFMDSVSWPSPAAQGALGANAYLQDASINDDAESDAAFIASGAPPYDASGAADSTGNFTVSEKGAVVPHVNSANAGQAALDAAAVEYLGTGSALQLAYDAALAALNAYLAIQTSPVAWNDYSGTTVLIPD